MIIKHANVVLKTGTRQCDLRIENGRIAEIGEICGEGLDCAGLTVFPGLIDMHVHLREPGFERKEDIASGSRAAFMPPIAASSLPACPFVIAPIG